MATKSTVSNVVFPQKLSPDPLIWFALLGMHKKPGVVSILVVDVTD